ncbi:Uncharacterized protein FWK35_00024634 [Aphis craccivora]|uniref:Phospholipase A2-like domain-containing protein n=1 Tax=Aphis craccivora TaxID=307492 RepID=A0A6G0Y0W6_APHCR|nr:Uncharacterized protein FWK35_00024634 [Aphis craccivora]
MSLARRNNKNKGNGLINTLINKLPFELHVPGYQYCEPGTNLKTRLARGDKGINALDSACKDHDIAYDHSSSIEDRNKADYILKQQAWDSLKEKAIAWGVTTAMKVKRKIGAECGYKAVIKAIKNVMRKNIGEKYLIKLTKKCVAVARKVCKSKKTKVPRIITMPKKGGVLPLIPISAGLSALGALSGGIANVIKVANDFERNTPAHLGNCLNLAPYKGNSYKIGAGITPVSVENSIASILGFRNVLYTTGMTHESENTVKIMKINNIKVECNLITSSFCDGAPSQIIHELYPTVAAGYKIVEVLRHPVFYGLNTTSISRVNIVFKDQNDCLINLRGESITIRLQITR